MELSKEINERIQFNNKIYNLYQQIKQMKLKKCITYVKETGNTETANIIKKSITNRSADTNEIYFKMDDFMSWSIHEHNFNDIVVNEDSIQLFENELYIVTFTK
jgi:hypothetical protein